MNEEIYELNKKIELLDLEVKPIISNLSNLENQRKDLLVQKDKLERKLKEENLRKLDWKNKFILQEMIEEDGFDHGIWLFYILSMKVKPLRYNEYATLVNDTIAIKINNIEYIDDNGLESLIVKRMKDRVRLNILDSYHIISTKMAKAILSIHCRWLKIPDISEQKCLVKNISKQ